MHRQISQLLMFGDLPEDHLLVGLSKCFEEFESGDYVKMDLIRRIHVQMKHLLEIATDFGFDDNLWHNYLTFFLMMSENPFTLTCEKVGAREGTVQELVLEDIDRIRGLFSYDFTAVEEALGIRCFHLISNYKAVEKKELMYNRSVSEKVRSLSKKLAGAASSEEFFQHITNFYKEYGVGMFGLNKAFRLEEQHTDKVQFRPINNMDMVVLDDLVGYELQKKKLVENTEAFVNGKPANNVLLFGDSGTGKSTSIKAIVNEYYKDGLRMIEIYKHQFKYLSKIIAEIKNRNYKFIIYMDDLSFEEHEIEYKFLKAVIEGGVETKPDNILIYATSNRRHLIKETWNDRNDMEHTNDRHHSDTVEEKLSLVNRFGVTIGYSKPNKQAFNEIVVTLARRVGITMSDEELALEANKWEMSHGGISGRTAQQFIMHLQGQESC